MTKTLEAAAEKQNGVNTEELGILNSAADVLATGFRRTILPIPEWNGRKVAVCELNARDRIRAQQMSQAVYVRGETQDKQGNQYPDPLAWLATRSLCDKDGNLLFAESDADKLSDQLGGAAVERIAEAAQELSQVQRPAAEVSNLARAYLQLAGMPAELDDAAAMKWANEHSEAELPANLRGQALDDWIAENLAVKGTPEKNPKRKPPAEEL